MKFLYYLWIISGIFVEDPYHTKEEPDKPNSGGDEMANKPYSKKDLEIIVELRKDSRSQLTTISKHTGIPISTIYDRLKNKSGALIKKNISILNFDLLGFNTTAKVCIKAGKSKKKELIEYLSKHQNVNSLFKINNGFDYLVEVIFKNVKDLEEFLEEVDEKFIIRQRVVFYVIDDIIRERFLSESVHLDLV